MTIDKYQRSRFDSLPFSLGHIFFSQITSSVFTEQPMDETTLLYSIVPITPGLGLHCLPMSHRKDARLIWVKDIKTGSNRP